MSEELDLDLELPRNQRIFAWVAALLMAFVASMAFRESWIQGQRGPVLWIRGGFQFLQSWVLFQAVSLIDAHCLRIEAGLLQVVPRVQKVPWLRRWAKKPLSLPLSQVALEWIGPLLTLQDPERGLSLRLGYRTGSGNSVAAWLVAKGVRPPVGA